MSGTLLFGENLLDPDTMSGFTSSSENPSYPLVNSYNLNRRSKVFRTAGYWEITSANKGIVFQEVIGVNLTANVAEANYSSSAALCAAIKAALQAAGTCTYTVSLDATSLKFKIASDGAGGKIFRLIATNVASTLLPVLGYSAATDKTGALTYTAELLRIHTSEWIKVDLGMTANPRGIFLVGTSLNGLKIQNGATVRIQGNLTDAWGAPSLDQVMTVNSDCIPLWNANGVAGSAMRYFRIKVIDVDNPNGYVEVANLYIGDGFFPTRGRVQFPLAGNVVDTSETSYSESGQAISDPGVQVDVFTLSWFGLTLDEKERIMEIFAKCGTHSGLIVVLDPDSTFSSFASKYTRLVKFVEEPTWRLVSPNNFTLDMKIREQV